MNRHTPTTELPLPPVEPAALPATDAEPDADGETGGEWLLLVPQQSEIAMRLNRDGSASIRQREWPDDDPTIEIQKENLQQFLDGVCDVLGVPSLGRGD